MAAFTLAGRVDNLGPIRGLTVGKIIFTTFAHSTLAHCEVFAVLNFFT